MHGANIRVVNTEERLFAVGDLGMALAAQQDKARQAIDKWDPEQLLATAEADVIEYLLAEYSVACPVLHRDQIEQLPVSEEVQSVPGWPCESYRQRMTKIVIAVPFDGDKEVFKLHPGNFTLNPPSADVREGELRLTRAGDVQASASPDAIKTFFDGRLDTIEQHLSWARADIGRYNANLRTLVRSGVTQRKARLLADRKLEASLGYPVRERPDASRYSVPVTRRKVDTPRRPTASGPFQPEPVLPDKQYEQALEVLRKARNALERTPSMTAHLDEEKIRDLLLVF